MGLPPGHADVMYITEAAPPLVATLLSVADERTAILIAHGRNRQAEGAFLRACTGLFRITDVPSAELDPLYQCTDVSVLRLEKL